MRTENGIGNKMPERVKREKKYHLIQDKEKEIVLAVRCDIFISSFLYFVQGQSAPTIVMQTFQMIA